MRRLALAALACVAALSAGEMVTIPAGEFTMGRTRLTSDDKTNMRPHVLLDDRPARRVFVSGFQLDAKEVTQTEYSRFLAATKQVAAPYHWPRGPGAKLPAGEGQFPVYNVNWDEARAYCGWVGGRLPTEAEWERAARGGLEAMDYPTGDKLDAKLALFDVATGPGPTGAYPPNAFGLYDMAGGVSEWTADWFAGDYYGRGEDRDPKGPASGGYRVIRGGAWSDSGRRATVFFRNWVRPGQRTPNLGFRCAK